jgi:hypothetical protein
VDGISGLLLPICRNKKTVAPEGDGREVWIAGPWLEGKDRRPFGAMARAS